VSAVVGALIGVLGSGAGGLLVPRLARRLPEPYAEATPSLARAVFLSAVAGGLVGLAVGLDWPLLPLVPLVPVAVMLALLDQATHLIPTVVVWPTLGVVVVLAAVGALVAGEPGALLRGAEGAAVVGALFYVLWWLHSAGMGFGDVRLSVVVGFVLGCLGWAELLIGVYGGFVVFTVLAVGRAIAHRDRSLLRKPSPYGPAMLGGALAAILVGSYLASR
jgi:leader peptidase (prepilin peptidase) / N-methyltransferase